MVTEEMEIAMAESLTTSDIDEEAREFDDPGDFMDAVAHEYVDWTPDPMAGFPKEYVIYYTGPRGSSKTLQLARMSLLALEQNIPVFTNLELYPEKAGIKAKPNPVDLQFLLSFDESLTNAVITISEIDTWFDRMRETSTGNRLGGKFLQQLRKKGLRIGFDTQDYLPGGLMRQVDKLMIGHDFVFTDWGREKSIPEGTTFYYDCWDYSGRFTGHRGRYWREALYHAEKVWTLFNTYKIHDPLEFARKLKIVGGDMEFNRDTHEMYNVAEKEQRDWERNIAGFSVQAKRVIDAYKASGFLDLAQQFKAVREFKSLYRFSCSKLGQMIANLDGEERTQAQLVYDELRVLAAQHGMARYHPNKNYIELAKPVTEQEAQYE